MDAPIANSTPISLALSGLELTGRASTHVRELAEMRCPLHPLAATALQAMRAAAAAAGIDLMPVSGFRDFARQLAIWNDKFSGARPLLDRAGRPLAAEALNEAERVAAILVWSALPGASRHHWGSDCDLIDGAALPAGAAVDLLGKHYAADGCYARLSAWLAQHAHDFGFFLPYDLDRGGVQPEPWHWSYAPIAAAAQAALRPDLLRAALADSGLLGWATVDRELPRIFGRYVSAVAGAPPAALAAAALSRAARPA
ncbi:MAG TPA: M15 family metallopeptidase [Steroidobacteraceae bacterium]